MTSIKRLLRPAKRAYSTVEKQLYGRGLLSPNGLPLPDFLGIGSAQSGTTWLYANLDAHPEVYLSPLKEAHYFDRRFHWLIREYSELFDQGEGRRKGEITPGYAILHPKRIQFIRRIMPDVRLIIILRNPIERSWSAARRVISEEAAKRGIPFDAVPDAEIREYLTKEHDYKPRRGNRGAYGRGMRRGNYTRILDNWLDVFTSDQLLVCFFEDIALRPQWLLTQVFNHIGVSPTVDWASMPFTKVVNQNPRHTLPPAMKEFLEEMYCAEIEQLFQRFGEPVRGWRCG